MSGLDWMARGACRQADPELFFTEVGQDMAKRLCRHCPVAAQCLAWALPQTDLSGVWGATTKSDRAQLRAAIEVRRRGAA